MTTTNNSLYADFATKQIIAAMQAIPGKMYLGEMPIKDTPELLLYARLRYAIERKLTLSP